MSTASVVRELRPVGGLTMRRWLALAWVSYAFMPGVSLGIVYGILRLLTGRDISKEPIFSVAVIAAVMTQIGVLVATGVLLGWWVVRPLTAMSRASRRIAAEGLADAQPSIPPSRVREVAEATAAFGAMREGLRESLRRQAELEQERRFFVGAIAHDLRTPLFSLRGYLEGLGKGITNTPEKTARYVAVCQQKADDLEHLVSDLFAYSQLDYVDRAPECEIVDVRVLLREAVEGARPQAEEKGVALLLEEPDEASAVMASSHLLARAVGNLLDNALRHTPMGGSVRVALRRKGEDWVFTVADTGPGIAPHDLPHIFDPLYRGEASRSRRTGGVGLGLAIARRALRAYDGELTATNGPAGGALFTGTLPGISPTITRARHDIRDVRFEADGADTITRAAPHTAKETL